MASIKSESFLNIFFNWMDGNKDTPNLEATPIDWDIDVVDLTLILQAIGFRLEFFDFENQTAGDQLDDLNVEIKCPKSGIRSKLSYKINNCNCPEKCNLNNNSFWEVQGRAPKTPASTNKIQESSSNLLPEVTKQCVVLSKAVLSALFRYYRENIKSNETKSPPKTPQAINKVIEKFNAHAKINDDKHINDDLSKVKSAVADILQRVKTEQDSNNMHVDIKTPFSTPLSSINVTPMNQAPLCSPLIPPKIIINENKCDTPPAEGNITNNALNKAKFISPEISVNENWENLFTSSPCNSTNNEITIQTENTKDLNVIQAITEARKKLDTALLFMRLNLTQEITSSVIGAPSPNTTPKMNPTNLTPAAPIININKRHSLSNLPRNHQINPKSALSMSFKAKTAATISTARQISNTANNKQMAPPVNVPLQFKRTTTLSGTGKPDTPRPVIPTAKAKAISSAINSDENKLLIRTVKRMPVTSTLAAKPTTVKSQTVKPMLKAPTIIKKEN